MDRYRVLVRWDGPRHPAFGTYSARLQSFQETWPHPNHSAEAFSEAGFFYTAIDLRISAANNGTHSILHPHISIFHILTGFSDETRCFHCGVWLKFGNLRTIRGGSMAHGSRTVSTSVTFGK